MTSSPASPEIPEHKYSQETATANNNEAEDHRQKPTLLTTTRARTIERAHRCELDHNFQHNNHDNTKDNNNVQAFVSANNEKDADWLHTNQQLNGNAITSSNTNEQCVLIFAANTLKNEKWTPPMDSTNLSRDAFM